MTAADDAVRGRSPGDAVEAPAGSAVLALVGPTAAGKSAVAVDAAERLDAEVVAVDAFTVYRGMDVGTAKPSAAERRRVPHHMVDVLEPEQVCTASWFQEEARRAIADIRRRGRRPLLVGGSGLYFRAVVDDLEFPPTDADVRRAVEERVGRDPAAGHAELQRLDPQAAARIEPGNIRRTVRALEVIQLTGRSFSDWRRAWDTYASRYPALEVIGIDVPRGVLDARIADRAARMVVGGLLDEARRLRDRQLSTTARAAIGYAEAFAHLDGGDDVEGTDALVEAIRLRTRRFALRQQRWFCADPRVRWMPLAAAREELMA